jgi:ribosomal protein S18 acetylase RimI-like enzyme
VIVTRPLTEADVARAAEVLGRAFHDYPWTRWTVDSRDHVARLTELQFLCLQHFGLPYGLVSVTEVDGVVQCVAQWADTANPVPPDVVTPLLTRFAELEGDRAEASAAADAESHGWRPRERHLYLATMGTAPEHQGRGLGAATLAPGLEFADAHRLSACLETSSDSNVRFYVSLGFEIVRYLRVADGAGPPLWLLQRRPLTNTVWR